jgi:uncharacterized protein
MNAKTFIEKTITDQDKMTEVLQEKINKATTIAELEDIYLPYKPKRKTKAKRARENGLETIGQSYTCAGRHRSACYCQHIH